MPLGPVGFLLLGQLVLLFNADGIKDFLKCIQAPCWALSSAKFMLTYEWVHYHFHTCKVLWLLLWIFKLEEAFSTTIEATHMSKPLQGNRNWREKCQPWQKRRWLCWPDQKTMKNNNAHWDITPHCIEAEEEEEKEEKKSYMCQKLLQIRPTCCDATPEYMRLSLSDFQLLVQKQEHESSSATLSCQVM